MTYEKEHTATRRPRRVRLSPEVRRQQLLDSAAVVVVTHGSAGLTMETLAAEAGVSKALVYLHFADRTDVLRSLFEREIGDVDVAAPDALERAKMLEEKLVVSLRLYLDAIDARGPVFHILINEPNVNADLEKNRQRRADVHAQFWTDILVAELGVSTEVAVLLCDQFLAAANAAARRYLGGEMSRTAVEESWLTFVTRGLAGFKRDA